jgi:glycine hydroxymethyltransferase
MLVDLRAKSITGKDAEAVLGRAHMTVQQERHSQRSARSRASPAGIRLGTPAMTTRGFSDERGRGRSAT